MFLQLLAGDLLCDSKPRYDFQHYPKSQQLLLVTWSVQSNKLRKLWLNIFQLFSISDKPFHILQNGQQLGVATLQTSPRYEERAHYFRLLFLQICQSITNCRNIFFNQGNLTLDLVYLMTGLEKTEWVVIAFCLKRLFSISAKELRDRSTHFWFHSRKVTWLCPIKCIFFTASTSSFNWKIVQLFFFLF